MKKYLLGALVAVRVGERLDRQPRRRRGIPLTPRVVLVGAALLVVFAIGAVRSGYGGRLTQAVAEATTAAERAAARCGI